MTNITVQEIRERWAMIHFMPEWSQQDPTSDEITLMLDVMATIAAGAENAQELAQVFMDGYPKGIATI
jgi:GAF domain-containing protein